MIAKTKIQHSKRKPTSSDPKENQQTNYPKKSMPKGDDDERQTLKPGYDIFTY